MSIDIVGRKSYEVNEGREREVVKRELLQYGTAVRNLFDGICRWWYHYVLHGTYTREICLST